MNYKREAKKLISSEASEVSQEIASPCGENKQKKKKAIYKTDATGTQNRGKKDQTPYLVPQYPTFKVFGFL